MAHPPRRRTRRWRAAEAAARRQRCGAGAGAAAAEAEPPPLETPPLKEWVHPTKGAQAVESASRWTADEWAQNMAALAAKECAEDEVLACPFTPNASAHLIFSEQSHGLRASTVGQLDGGVSLCLWLPYDMGWEPYGRGGDAFGSAGTYS